jgi:hypothetical protein
MRSHQCSFQCPKAISADRWRSESKSGRRSTSTEKRKGIAVRDKNPFAAAQRYEFWEMAGAIRFNFESRKSAIWKTKGRDTASKDSNRWRHRQQTQNPSAKPSLEHV